MAIFTDNVRQVEAPSNSQLTLALAKAIGENNVGKALGDTFRDFAGLTHDYTYGTSMGIANDIKKARDLLGAAKDENGLFLNSNDKVQELLRAQNPNWTANNYADANMEAWLKEREGEGRALEKLKLDKEEGGRSQQRLNLQIAQANAQMRKDRLLEQAQALQSEFIKAKAQGWGTAWMNRNQSILDANPYAKAQVYGIAGDDLQEYSPVDNAVTLQAIKDSDLLTKAIRENEEARRTLANTDGISTVINADGSLKHESSNQVFERLAKGRNYTGDDYGNFQENWNDAYNAIKAKFNNLSDEQIGAILENAIETRGWTGWWRVDDWDVAGSGKHFNAAKKVQTALGDIAKYKTLTEKGNALEELRKNDTVKKAQTAYSNKVKNIQAAQARGNISAAEAQRALKRAEAEAAAAIQPALDLLNSAKLAASVIPVTTGMTH